MRRRQTPTELDPHGCAAWLVSQEHVSIFGPQQFVKSTVLPDVSALFGAADVARPRDLSRFVEQCLEEPGSLSMNTKAGTDPAAEQQLAKLQARFRGPSTALCRRSTRYDSLCVADVCVAMAGHLSRTGRSHLVHDAGAGGVGSDGLPSFDTVQYLNSQVRPMLIDALVKVGRDRPKQPSRALAAAVAAR